MEKNRDNGVMKWTKMEKNRDDGIMKWTKDGERDKNDEKFES